MSLSSFLLNGWTEDIGTGLLFGIPSGIAVFRKLRQNHREQRQRLDHIIRHHPAIPDLPSKETHD